METEPISSSPAAPPPPPIPAPARLRRFVGRLTEAYRRTAAAAESPPADQVRPPHQLAALQLTEAGIRYCPPDARPPQVAVIGPTQTGKSTMVNLLLGRGVSEVSPLAGFTVHPQGFYITPSPNDPAWAGTLFPEWQRTDPGQLTRENLAAYSLTGIAPQPGQDLFTNSATTLSNVVVWDTPDFDSLAALRYQRGVLEVLALADLYVLVLSKEKYSDLSVWRLLELLDPLARPLLICLNKVSGEAERIITASLRERLAERGPAWGEVPIVTLPHEPGLAAGRWGEFRALAAEVRTAVRAGVDTARCAAAERAPGVQALCRRHWDDWLAPVHTEHQAVERWQGLVDDAADTFLRAYKRDYLEHPERFDSFRRAALELLDLLELPKIGGVMARTRRVVTWPARQALRAGRAWWRERRPPRDPVHSLGAEATVLIDAVDALLAGVERDVARRSTSAEPAVAVWRALAVRLRGGRGALRETFEAAIKAHHEQVTREIRSSANELYRELQKHPGRLVALRTARATIDVGYLLLAVKTGGLSPLDALWAPASFAVTSLLMEGVAGLEMGRVAQDLKKRQWEAVKERFVEQVLLAELRRAGDELSSAGLFAISPAEVEQAAHALHAWEAGDG